MILIGIGATGTVSKGLVCYILICWFMQKYTYIGWIHTDAIIIKTPDDKVARTNDARKEDAGRLLYNIFYLTSLFVSFERVVPSLRERECWRPGPVLDFGPERGPGKGTMADLGPLIRHLVSTRLPSGGRAAFLSRLSPMHGTRPSVLFKQFTGIRARTHIWVRETAFLIRLTLH